MTCSIRSWSIAAALLISSFAINALANNRLYHRGYQDACTFFRQWLLDVEYAEYDRRTGEWKLADVDDLQGRLIEPKRRVNFIDITDHIKALEDELSLLKKQQGLLNKRKSNKALDIAAVP